MAAIYSDMFDTFENYKSFLKALPEQVKTTIMTLELPSLSQYINVLEPSINSVMPIAKNRLDTWMRMRT